MQSAIHNPQSAFSVPRSAFRAPHSSRRGTVLLMVLVVVVLLSLGAYTFSEFMVVEAEATAMFGRNVQARAFADSGLELVASHLANRADRNPETYFNNPAWFQGILMRQGVGAKGMGRFSVVAPLEHDPTGQSIRFGLTDESAKLNLNMLMKFGLDAEQSRLLLLALPEMTEYIADGILDYLDEDEDIREFGAESEYYLSLSPSYEPKNGPLDSLDELLLVSGVTPWLLFGEDANRNGLLDLNENDGDLNPPLDNADGVLQRGWAAYLTIHSRETNVRADGTDRVNVSQNDLAALYDALLEEFDEETAAFVVAYRVAGPLQQAGSTATGQTSGSGGGSPSGGGASSGGSGGSGGRGTSGGGDSSGGGATNSAASQTAALQAASALGSALAAAGGGRVTRGGIDLTSGGKYAIKSLYDVVGVQVRVQVNGVSTTLDSPWTDDPGDMRSYLPDLMEKLTVSAQPSIDGRVNINEAKWEVLLGVPNMTEELADAIVDSQFTGVNGESLADQVSERATTGWLFMNGLVDLPTLRALDPYITARGDVFRLQVVGHFDAGGPVARIEAVIDATQNPPQVVFLRDLSDLGRGYSTQQLLGGSSGGY